MARERTVVKGIVLRAVDTKESDKILTVLTSGGKLPVVAKGAIKEENTDPVSFGNARGVRNIFEQILVNQANRLAAMEHVTREDLMSITPADVQAARGAEVPVPAPGRPEA